MKINILRAFWNFEVNELSTASRGRRQILRPPRAGKTVATPLLSSYEFCGANSRALTS